MPRICSSADLRNDYNEISQYCKNTDEPVFITKNGKGDLAVMSMEAYDNIVAREELYFQLRKGLDEIAAGQSIPLENVVSELRNREKNNG